MKLKSEKSVTIKNYIFLLKKLQVRSSFWFKIYFLFNELLTKLLYHKSTARIGQLSVTFNSDDNGTVFVRKLGLSDSNNLFDLLNKGFSKESRKSIIFYTHDIRSLQKMMRYQSCVFLGLFKNDKMVGCAILKLLMTRDAFLIYTISEQWRGQKLGSRLVRILVNFMRELKFSIYCTVFKDNTSSLQILKSENFRILGENEKEYIFQKKTM